MTQTARKISPVIKALLRFQVFMLRRNMMGKMSDFIMVVTVTGRKSGKSYSTPIGYLRDGHNFIGINPGGVGNWFKNLSANPQVMLNVRGKDLKAHAEIVTDAAEIDRLFDLYRMQVAPATFPRLFGVAHDAPEAELMKARDSRRYVKFIPLV
jgi:deazaflavin-dependent oxidoreductase (nitroreductase family)